MNERCSGYFKSKNYYRLMNRVIQQYLSHYWNIIKQYFGMNEISINLLLFYCDQMWRNLIDVSKFYKA